MFGVLAATTALAGSLGMPTAAVGDHVESAHRTALSLTLDVRTGGRVVPVSLGKTHDQRSDLRVLDLAAGPQLRITWTHNHQADHGPDGSRDFDLPVHGRTYVVHRREARVLHEGTPARADEAAIALQAADVFDLQRTLRDMWADAPLEIGHRVPAGPMFGGLMRDAPGTPTVDGWLTLRALRDIDGVRCAELDLTLSLSASGDLEPGVHADITADLSGTVVVEVDRGWTRSLSVRGPVRLDGRGTRHGQSFTLSGRGTFSSDTTTRVRP